MTTQNLADILVKCGVVQSSYETDEQNIVMLGRIAEAVVMVSAREADWQACAEKLSEELSSFKTQRGCECGHPACKICRDTRDSEVALAEFEKLKGKP